MAPVGEGDFKGREYSTFTKFLKDLTITLHPREGDQHRRPLTAEGRERQARREEPQPLGHSGRALPCTCPDAGQTHRPRPHRKPRSLCGL